MLEPTTRPRALVVYESMFGNTATIAGSVATGLRLEDVEVELVHVSDAVGRDLHGVDLLVVGGPTHAFSLSRPTTREDAVRQGAPADVAAPGLREWIDALPQTQDGGPHLAATFDTRATKVRYLPKAASGRAARMLRHHGFDLLARPTGFLVEDVQGGLVDGEPERAVTWARQVAVECRGRIASTAVK